MSIVFNGIMGRSLKKHDWLEVEGAEDGLDAAADTMPEEDVIKAFPVLAEAEVIKSAAVAIRSLALRQIRDYRDQIHEALTFCQSPIEAIFAAAFITLVTSQAEPCMIIVNRPGGPNYYPLSSNQNEELAGPNIVIEFQSEIGKYRLDFLIHRTQTIHSTTKNSEGKIVRASALFTWQMAVECDGHNFHEKTKTQVAHDKKRDRVLQSVGLRVFRFSGSEIWADAIGCAKEVYAQMEKDEDAKRDDMKSSVNPFERDN